MTIRPRALALTALTLLLGMIGGALLLASTPAAGQAASAGAAARGELWTWGMMSAALATAASSLAGGYAVGRVGVAAVGALAEKPELFGRLLILVGIAEGIAIYGLIVSILILNRLT